MRKSRLIGIALLFAVLPPLVISAAWLSDKSASGSSSNATGSRNPHDYLYPTIKVSDSNFPMVSLISAGYQAGSRSVQITWQDSTIKKQGLSPATLRAFGPRISWDNQGKAQFRYALYRSREMIASESIFYKATKIGVVYAGTMKFQDTTVQSGKYHYAVSVLDEGDTEYFKPSYDQSYTSEPVAVADLPNPVTGLMASYDRVNNRVNLSWSHDKPQSTTYRVYVSRSRILTPASPGRLQMLGTAGSNQTTFQYAPTASGSYYYAVIPLGSDGVMNTAMSSANSLATPLLVNLPPAGAGALPAMVTALKASYDLSAKVMAVSWLYQTDERPGLQVYMNHQNMITNEGILQSSKLIKDFRPGTSLTNFKISDAWAGSHYLAIISYNASGVFNRKLIPNWNVTTNPVSVPGLKAAAATRYVIATNYLFITNITPVFITNYTEITRETLKPLSSTYTNITITNTATVTNSITVTNYRFKTLFLTNRVIIKETGRSGQPDNGYRTSIRRTPLDTGYRDRITLRRIVKQFFRNRARRNRGGFRTNIQQLKAVMHSSTSQSVKDQCLLFIGRAYYNLGQHLIAFRHFVRLRRRLPDESRFWIRRCVSRMR